MISILEKLGRLACSSNDPAELVQANVNEVPQIISVRRVSLVLIDRQGINIPASIGLPPDARVIRHPGEAPIIKWVLEHAEPLIVTDIDADERFQHTSRREAYLSKSFVCLPLIDQKKVVGVLSLTDRTDDGTFVDQDLRALTIFTNYLAYSLRNSFLLTRLRRNEKLLKRSHNQLKQRFHEIKVLYRLWRGMNNVMDLGSLARFILRRMPAILSVRRASIIIRDTRTSKLFILESVGVGKEYEKQPYLASSPIAEWVITNRQPLLINDINSDPRFSTLRRDGYRTGGFICVPLIHKNEVYGVLNVADKRHQAGFAETDMRIMSIFGNQLGVSLANTQLLDEISRRDQIKEEMTIARQIQTQYLPARRPNLSGIEVGAHLSSAEEIGGDFYDWVERDDGRTAFFIGDVSGKGIPAALTMVLSTTHLAELMMSASDLSVFMKCGHRRICHFSKGIQYVTAGAMILSADRQHLEFSLAGHPPFLHYRAATGDIVELSEGGLPLGMYEDLDDYPFGAVDVQPGDAILLYTDGVIAARDRFDKPYTKKRLMETFAAHAQEPAFTVVEHLQGALTAHMTGVPPFDDYTLISLRIR